MVPSEIKKLAKNKSVTHCYIKKQGSYYRPDACGYTDRQSRAGIYEKEEAIGHARACMQIQLIPVVPAEHNKNILEEVNDLLSRII